MQEMMIYYILFGILIVLCLYIAFRVSFNHRKKDQKEMVDSLKDIKGDLIKELTENQLKIQNMQNEGLTKQLQMISDISIKNAEGNSNTQEVIRKGLIDIQESTEKRLIENSEKMTKAMYDGMSAIQEMTTSKLEDIQIGIDERLDKSLNKKVDESFKQVGDRLDALYKSLGELKNLEDGVHSLNRTLSNVKTRGIYGELQLGNILANILEKNQYVENINTNPKSSERVEFAVKIPDKVNKGGFIYLPIDSKFPADIYNKIINASENADAEALKVSTRELKDRIRLEAKSIADKYIYPPDTTDFAIMFLPTEGIYSEVLRIDGLVEECQEKYKIIISGPTTLSALLNSLSIGFRYLTVNNKTEEIMNILGNFKVQFQKFDELILKTQKKISEIQTCADNMQSRSSIIQKKLGKIETVDYENTELLEEEE